MVSKATLPLAFFAAKACAKSYLSELDSLPIPEECKTIIRYARSRFPLHDAVKDQYDEWVRKLGPYYADKAYYHTGPRVRFHFLKYAAPSPLKEAVMLRNFDIIAILNNIARQDYYSRTAMHYAASYYDVEGIKKLHKIDPQLVNIKTREGNLPLHIAAYKGNAKAIKALFDINPESLEEQNDDKQTPHKIIFDRYWLFKQKEWLVLKKELGLLDIS